MSCTIRKAASQDLPRIREIYEMARQFMRKNGNHSQWGKGDEPEALIEEDIRQGRSDLSGDRRRQLEVRGTLCCRA